MVVDITMSIPIPNFLTKKDISMSSLHLNVKGQTQYNKTSTWTKHIMRVDRDGADRGHDVTNHSIWRRPVRE